MLYLFRTHVMSLYDIETCFLKVHKKDLNIISVVCHMAIKRICGGNFYDGNHKCLDILNFRIFPSVFSLFTSFAEWSSGKVWAKKYAFRRKKATEWHFISFLGTLRNTTNLLFYNQMKLMRNNSLPIFVCRIYFYFYCSMNTNNYPPAKSPWPLAKMRFNPLFQKIFCKGFVSFRMSPNIKCTVGFNIKFVLP